MCTEISRKSWRIYDLLLSPRTDELQDELFCVALSVVPFMGHTQLSFKRKSGSWNHNHNRK